MTNPFGTPGENPNQNPYGSGQSDPQTPNNPYGAPSNQPQGNQFGGQSSASPYGQAPGGSQPSYGQPSYGQSPSEPVQGGYNQSPYGQQPYPQQGYDQQGYAQQGYAQQGYAQYAGQTPKAGAFDTMNSFNQGWKIFRENPTPWVVGTLVYGLISIVMFAVAFVPLIAWSSAESNKVYSSYSSSYGASFESTSSEPPLGLMALMGVMMIVFSLVMVLLQAIMTRNAMAAVAGKQLAIGDFFKFHGIGLILGVTIVLQIAIQIAGITYIGGIVLAFLMAFAAYAAAVPGMGFVDAYKKSFQVTTGNFVQTLLLMVFAGLASMAGMLALGVGLLVAGPVIALATAHAYQTATGGAVQTRV